MSKIGFTTSIPVEVLLAAGRVPVDLNNIFIASPDSRAWVDQAEEAGYPRSTCGWIKGLYAPLQMIWKFIALQWTAQHHLKKP
jgi:benzoyl-CoA reductase/2-hydroxyglutaryl-CoA dehydratase subunit BcrC/BadD/HgdB